MAHNVPSRRVSEQTFLVSISILFAFSLGTVCCRYIVFITRRRLFQLEDALIFCSACCMIVAVAIFLTLNDKLHVSSSATSKQHIAGEQHNSGYINTNNLISAGLVLAWTALIGIKIAFVVFFLRLADSRKIFYKYCWAVLIFNLVALVYGLVMYCMRCPSFGTGPGTTCSRHALSQTNTVLVYVQLVVDIIGDLLVLVMPVYLVKSIQHTRRQGLILTSSPFLTTAFIAVSITRSAGIQWHGKHDFIWEIYFLIITALLGLILVATTAIDSLFPATRSGAKISSDSPVSTSSSPKQFLISRKPVPRHQDFHFCSDDRKPLTSHPSRPTIRTSGIFLQEKYSPSISPQSATSSPLNIPLPTFPPNQRASRQWMLPHLNLNPPSEPPQHLPQVPSPTHRHGRRRTISPSPSWRRGAIFDTPEPESEEETWSFRKSLSDKQRRATVERKGIECNRFWYDHVDMEKAC